MVVQLGEYTNSIELYTLNGQTVWYVNYISIKKKKHYVLYFNSYHGFVKERGVPWWPSG